MECCGAGGVVSLLWWYAFVTQASVEKLSNDLKPELLILSGIGVANIIVFRNKVSKHMKLVQDTEDDMDQAIERLVEVTIEETTDPKRDQTIYNTRISFHDTLASSSPTMLKLFSRLSLKLDGNFAATMAGNMVICAISNKPTKLQVAPP